MTLTKNREKDRWEWSGDFHSRHIPKAAKFRWDPKAKVWWTTSEEKAAQLAEYADSEAAKKALAKLDEQRKEAITQSRAQDADIEIPAPEGEAYMPFQKAGIAYAQGRENVLFGDDMGLGKTIQALGAINLDPTIKKVLVICPATLKLNWRDEAEKWLVRPFEVGVLSGNPDTVTQSYDLARWDMCIINYDILSKWKECLDMVSWDLIICDESHYLKNPKTGRTKMVFGGDWDKEKREYKYQPLKAKRRFFLTGTFFVNRPIEGWPLLKAVGIFRSWKYYVERYCNGYKDGWGWKTGGSSNLEELQRVLREKIMVRRLKKDVLSELPPKTRQVIPVPLNGNTAMRKAVEAEKAEYARRKAHLEELKAAVKAAKASDNPEVYKEAVKALNHAQFLAFTEMAAARRDVALAKVDHVIAHLIDACESHKVVCFAWHKEVIDRICEGVQKGLEKIDKNMAGVVRITGDTPMGVRHQNVEDFQSEERVRLFVGNMQAAGVGITLTAASHVVFAEIDWVPGNITQAEDRCVRIGQTADNVLVQHLVVEDSIDANMAKSIVKKQEVIDRALDRPIPEGNDEVEAAKQRAEDEKAGENKNAGRKKGLDAIAEKMTDDQIFAVQMALQTLASRCDGAFSEDGMGFNKFDTRIGKDLAGKETLTKRQAALGRKIVLKYHGQLPAELVTLIKGE